MSSLSLTDALKREAVRLGFDLVGTCPAVPPPGIARFRQWLAAGYAGEMTYLKDRAEAYADPCRVLEGARSILMLGISYRSVEPNPVDTGQGRVSRYAWGRDYHRVVRRKLRALADLHRRLAPAAACRGVVDTAPLLEREFGQMAGLGWIGKNTLLLNRRLGSWFFLAALLTTEVLEYDAPHQVDHCGRCRACLEACPTGALIAPRVLDARRCISYLTIELRADVPPDLRANVGEWFFGCDVCQEVCPWNTKAESGSNLEFAPHPGNNPVELAGLFFMDAEALRQRFQSTPLWRAKRRGLLRNAAVVLGNRYDESCLDALIHGLDDVEPMVRRACAWAMSQYPSPRAGAALQTRLETENDPSVRHELETALQALKSEKAVKSSS